MFGEQFYLRHKLLREQFQQISLNLLMPSKLPLWRKSPRGSSSRSGLLCGPFAENCKELPLSSCQARQELISQRCGLALSHRLHTAGAQKFPLLWCQRNYLSTKLFNYILHIVCILKVIEGAGRVDKISSLPQRRPYIIKDSPLTLRAELNIVKAPLPYCIGILAEHALSRTGGIYKNKVKEILQL